MTTTKRFLSLLVATLCSAVAATAQVPPTTIFQLDGNAAQSASYPACTYGSPCDYFNLLNGTGVGNPAGSPGHSLVRTFINGTGSSTPSFTGGGSKDSNLLSQWAYTIGSTPNKDKLDAGYAAAYEVSGDFELIFGADRASPNGDANIGIWFFQQAVGLNSTGGFTGAHADHDIFVISAFTGGGGVSTISVYEWDHTCASGVKNPTAGQCSDTNLRLLASPAASCGSSIYCAVTNSATTSTTWEGNLASPLFFEGGIDLTAALAAVGVNQLPCFSSFLEETRSSQSTTAVLKDFILGGFPVCGLSITKSCGTSSVDPSGTFINYPVNGMVTNTGVGTLYNVTVFDTVGGSTNQVSVSPSTLGPGAQGTWSDSSTSTSSSQSDSAIAKGATSSASGATLDVTSSNTATATCTNSPVTTLTVTKSCTTSLGTTANPFSVTIQVGFSGQVCNTGPSDVTGITLTDYPSTSTSGTTVASGITLTPAGTSGACVPYTGSYTPDHYDSAVNGGTGPGRYLFNDLVTITTATPKVGTLTKVSGQPDSRENGTYGFAPATCPLCQGTGECTAQ